MNPIVTSCDEDEAKGGRGGGDDGSVCIGTPIHFGTVFGMLELEIKDFAKV